MTGGDGLAVPPGDDAVDEDQADPGGVLARSVVAGPGGDAAGSDDADVGGHPGRQPPRTEGVEDRQCRRQLRLSGLSW